MRYYSIWWPFEEKHNAHVVYDKTEFDTPDLTRTSSCSKLHRDFELIKICSSSLFQLVQLEIRQWNLIVLDYTHISVLRYKTDLEDQYIKEYDINSIAKTVPKLNS